MAFLIAVTGLSGAGKTTAIDHLKRVGVGEKVYLGQTVLNEVQARRLPPGTESEQLVRLDFRSQYGPGALAILAKDNVRALLNDGTNVLVDAVFEMEEYQHLRTCTEGLRAVLLAIEASFETRSRRLLGRLNRPHTPEQLKARDKTEVTQLRTGLVMEAADHKIVNEDSLEIFYEDVELFWKVTAGVSLT
jgi:dephospho-CoA kinase